MDTSREYKPHTQDGLQVYNDPRAAPEPLQPGLESYNTRPYDQYAHYANAQPHHDSVHPHYGDIHHSSPNPAKPEDPKTPSSSDRVTICGLRKPTFWLTLALVIVIVVAAAVGGGVGSTIGRQQSSAQSEIPTSTRSPLQSLQPATPTPPAADNQTSTRSSTAPSSSATKTSRCGDSGPQSYRSADTGYVYDYVCNVDISWESPSSNIVKGVFDEFEPCVAMCDTWNEFQAELDDMNMVIWSWAGTGRAGAQTPGNCYCVSAETGYEMISVFGEDAALMRGTYNSSSISTD